MSYDSTISGSGSIQLVKLSVLRLGTVDGQTKPRPLHSVKRNYDLGISPVSQLRTLPKNSPEFENSSIGVQRDDHVYPSALNGGQRDPTTGTSGG